MNYFLCVAWLVPEDDIGSGVQRSNAGPWAKKQMTLLFTVDPHYNPSNHPFSINNIIANESKADLKLYEMSQYGGYNPLSPPIGGHTALPNDSSGYYHPSLYSMYQSATPSL
ncbi:hypothetical protein HPB47_012724 [Ixodes persulcatus]|uniref:Uncharacterized protein n=1 Tax=Ixodes persulcatus TaxID=34615 RepID=A0AC60NSR5_IXOPE|nr:hypothetical protein HPB47_012724 [Ixodes persulcatus]